MPTAPLVVWLSSMAMVGSLGLVWFVVAGARTATSSKRQLIGDAIPSVRDLSLEGSALERLADSLLHRLRELGRRVTPIGVATETEQRIARAGLSDRWTADRFIAMKGLLSLSVFLVGFIIALTRGAGTLIMVAAGLAFVFFFVPDLNLVRRANARDLEIQKQLGDIVDQILIAVEAGASLDSALDRISRGSEGPLQEEFRRVLQDVGFGMSRREAITAMIARTALPELRELLLAIAQSEEHGLSIGAILRVQASEIRDKRQRRAEEAAMKVPVKIVFPLILCILPCLMAIIIGPAIVQISRNINF